MIRAMGAYPGVTNSEKALANRKDVIAETRRLTNRK